MSLLSNIKHSEHRIKYASLKYTEIVRVLQNYLGIATCTGMSDDETHVGISDTLDNELQSILGEIERAYAALDLIQTELELEPAAEPTATDETPLLRRRRHGNIIQTWEDISEDMYEPVWLGMPVHARDVHFENVSDADEGTQEHEALGAFDRAERGMSWVIDVGEEAFGGEAVGENVGGGEAVLPENDGDEAGTGVQNDALSQALSEWSQSDSQTDPGRAWGLTPVETVADHAEPPPARPVPVVPAIVFKGAEDCCICFSEKTPVYFDDEIGSCLNVSKEWFEGNVLPSDMLLLAPCNKHYCCVGCLRRVVDDYENHPINRSSSHMYCPYPFLDCVTATGSRCIFEHSHIEKICATDEQFNRYTAHALKHSFPGFELVSCPARYFSRLTSTFVDCQSQVLVDVDSICNTEVGELIVTCDQNIFCFKRFCFYCQRVMRYGQLCCDVCRVSQENTNPMMFNRYFNKETDAEAAVHNEYAERPILKKEIMFRNFEVTADVALRQLTELIEDGTGWYVCPVCKVPMFKSEKCNAVCHHNIERCYVCGRIGEGSRGLGNHWNGSGVGGCYRFDYDSYLRDNFGYLCQEGVCHSHERGDCITEHHQPILRAIEDDRKRAYVYHAIKSLLPDVRYAVLEALYETYSGTSHYATLPYKYTFSALLDMNPDRLMDYSETIVYKALDLAGPETLIGEDKSRETVQEVVQDPEDSVPEDSMPDDSGAQEDGVGTFGRASYMYLYASTNPFNALHEEEPDDGVV